MNSSKTINYCRSLTKYSRSETSIVKIGEEEIGGNNPISIQSMTNTNTMDTKATVEQSIRIFEEGADYVRITAQTVKEAENLAQIKSGLLKRGYSKPLIADIHFNPKAAISAAKIIDKVRINPGNYIDKKNFKKINFTELEYKLEIEKIRQNLLPLLKVCKKHNTAIRIGTNHGSLSDRILSKYGDTPQGMIESTMEFLRICHNENFHNVVISMKASNTLIMVQANRLLVSEMKKEGMNYPIHLGVTEAGEGEDGRIKSAVGIGTLLNDGIGDTIRVSLTEEPEKEIPVAKKLLKYFNERENHQQIEQISKISFHPFKYQKRESYKTENIGSKNLPVVIADFSSGKINLSNLAEIGFFYDKENDKWNKNDFAVEYIFIGENEIDFNIPKDLGIIVNNKLWQSSKHKNENCFPIFDLQEFINSKKKSDKLNFINIKYSEFSQELFQSFKNDKTIVFLLHTNNLNGIAEQRAFFVKLQNHNIKIPVIINRAYSENSLESLQVKSSCDLGALFIDGFGDGIFIQNSNIDNTEISLEKINFISFAILQACRIRTSKTEYISCPSCGRTLFDLQATTAKIREKTHHLKGLKIGVMGCIVNGPGEMADADYGYVGTRKGEISLYKAQNVVKKNIPEKNAVEELISLIKENGDWKEK